MTAEQIKALEALRERLIDPRRCIEDSHQPARIVRQKDADRVVALIDTALATPPSVGDARLREQIEALRRFVVKQPVAGGPAYFAEDEHGAFIYRPAVLAAIGRNAVIPDDERAPCRCEIYQTCDKCRGALLALAPAPAPAPPAQDRRSTRPRGKP